MYDNLTRTNLEFAYRQAEKRIADLEKENAELQQQIVQLKKDVIENESDCAICGFRQKNTELGKENKKIFNDWLEACDKYGKVNLEQQKNKEQLEQATKLLRFWVNDFYDNFNHSNKYEERHKSIVETEQFLKDLEK